MGGSVMQGMFARPPVHAELYDIDGVTPVTELAAGASGGLRWAADAPDLKYIQNDSGSDLYFKYNDDGNIVGGESGSDWYDFIVHDGEYFAIPLQGITSLGVANRAGAPATASYEDADKNFVVAGFKG